MESENKSYTVTQYMKALKQKVESTPAVWVRGVITQINEKARVVYLSIADFEEGNVNPLATVPLYCYSAKFAAIRAKVENYPQPFTLKEQLKVSFLIKADLYIPYGKLQAQILDIDPVYTLGELALTKSAILKRLALEGLLEKNKSLTLADVPIRVGLITGEGTAAYKDFTTKLAESPFNFKVKTAYAKMQGTDTEPTVLAALEELAKDSELDVVCIIRGGGSKTDLNFFDSEALCRAVANYPLPVFTGIGHEIDRSLLDEVAYQSCITPTDTAKRLIDRVADSWNQMLSLAQGIALQTKDLVTSFKQELTYTGNALQQKVNALLQREAMKLTLYKGNMQKDLQFIFRGEQDRIDRNSEGLHQGTRKILDLEKSKFNLMELRVKNADPETTLSKGYTLTLDANGKFVRNKSQLKAGDTLTTRFKDGNVISVVK
ncbi:exodeoxyribonuclease VII large subunit [uncultured Fibrobacter sp.]|uniref:exodeoxyribonuclease VII large subunit n=1 Tax=uncultured Fibrobacter sp. TaxID=261512 RepID=UPI00260A2F72|nr:exodeoxyribonuclease VII large subunit [uncultured Fibrobacter sp.]